MAQDALALSDRERAELAHKILVSLDGVPDKGSEDEIARRVQKIRDGTAKGRPAGEVFDDIESRYK